MRRFSEKIALFIGLLFIFCPFLFEYFDNREFNLLFAYTIIGAILIILFLFKQKDGSVCLSLLDVVVSAIILYTCIRLSHQGVIDIMNVYTCCLLFVCYVLSKIVLTDQRDVRIVLYAVIVSGVLQAVLSILQLSNICITNHSLFDVTGSFANPGPLGGYISIALITAIGMLVLGKRNKKAKCFLYGSIMLLGVVSFLSDSRSSYFSTVVTLFLICIVGTGWIKKKIMAGLLLFFSVCLLISLYYYRPHSADARLFIWKVCGSMIKEKPVCGHGIASFPEKYMLYQADYFEMNPEAKEMAIASNNTLAFNEYILLLCEQGIIGFLLYTGMFIYILAIFPFLRKEKLIVLFILCAYAVFSMFSYPSAILPLLLFVPLCLGILSSVRTKYTYKVELSGEVRYLLMMPFLLIIGYASLNWFSCFRIDKTLTSYYLTDDADEAEILRNEFPEFRNNREFMMKYARVLYLKREYEDAVPALMRAIIQSPSSDKYGDLGKSYQALQQYEDAEDCYIMASKMLPAYIIPRYNLFLLYRETGRLDQARKQAKGIVAMKVKITSRYTEQIKDEVKNYLEEQK